MPFDPPPRNPRTEELLGEIPRELFGETLYLASELIERYALDLAYELAHELGVAGWLAGGEVRSAAEIGDAAGHSERFRSAFEWLLERLAEDGALEQTATTPRRFRAARPLRRGETAALRALGLGIDPEIGRTLDLLDAAAAAWPAVAKSGTTGEEQLFGAGRIGLWTAYFHNLNAPYAIGNRMTAAAAANRLPRGGGARVLEIGAGAGSATEALLTELERRGRICELGAYDVTEPSPFFRRRAERELKSRFPGTPLRFAGFDIDRPAADQGVAAGYDLIFGVNVLHVARALGASLAQLRSLLEPGGWLVAGECLRLFPGQPVAADVVFQIFKSFVEVETDPLLRPTHGFLETRTWRTALDAAGFVEIAVLPDLESIREVYPHFTAGVLVARAPGGRRSDGAGTG